MSENTSPSADSPPPSRLLVIDDEGAVLNLVKAMLTRANYEVTTCESAQEGLKFLEQTPFDCVITDAIMPVMTGYDFVQSVRKHPELCHIPVLMLTRKRHRQDVKRAVEAGVTDYVLKPIDEHLLLDKVELCLKKGGGKRHMVESPVSGPASQAEISVDCHISSVSESEMTMRLAFPLLPAMPFTLKTKLFEDMGIGSPLLKVLKTDRLSDPGMMAEFPYEAKISFVGVQEADLKKIRTWLRAQELKKKK